MTDKCDQELVGVRPADIDLARFNQAVASIGLTLTEAAQILNDFVASMPDDFWDWASEFSVDLSDPAELEARQRIPVRHINAGALGSRESGCSDDI